MVLLWAIVGRGKEGIEKGIKDEEASVLGFEGCVSFWPAKLGRKGYGGKSRSTNKGMIMAKDKGHLGVNMREEVYKALKVCWDQIKSLVCHAGKYSLKFVSNGLWSNDTDVIRAVFQRQCGRTIGRNQWR